jgi:hypothetical protein
LARYLSTIGAPIVEQFFRTCRNSVDLAFFVLKLLLLNSACRPAATNTHHGGRPEYRAKEADDQAWESALRPKWCLLAMQVELLQIVASKLILDWSPEQVSDG